MDMKRILVATDGSPGAIKALDLACDLALAHGAKLIALHVQAHHGGFGVPIEFREYMRLEQLRGEEVDLYRRASEHIVSNAARAARGRAVDLETMISDGDAAHQIVDAAKDREVDAIVMGSRGLGDVGGLFLGSVSHKVSHAAPCTCIVVR